MWGLLALYLLTICNIPNIKVPTFIVGTEIVKAITIMVPITISPVGTIKSPIVTWVPLSWASVVQVPI